ncbi:MAG TPA: VOC family protein [Puia sp.]|nr:VOC family protein [Puia sp.]
MEVHQLCPILWTKDLQKTISFYETVLRFKGKSNFPNFVSLSRGNIEIMFVVPQDEPEDCKDPNDRTEFFPKPVLTGSLYFFAENMDELWKSVKNKAEAKTPIADWGYMMRDFSIYDNNGYELVFGHDISKQ